MNFNQNFKISQVTEETLILGIDGRYSFPYIPEGVYGELRTADKLKDDITKQIISIKNKIHRWLSIYFPEYEKIYSSIDTKSGFLILKEK